MGLGRVVLSRRAIARQQRARGEKEGNADLSGQASAPKALKISF